jgi:hypothetical protein
VSREYDYDNWRPMRPEAAREEFAGLAAPWWIAGGWAIDLFLGRETRLHEDLDIGVLHRDHLAIQAHLIARGWNLHCAGDQPHTLRPWPIGESLALDNHCPWARRDANSPWEFQLLINPGDEQTFISRRGPDLRLPMREAVIERGGFRVLAPQVQLHFKAKQTRPRDEADFNNVLPLLDASARAWLRQALARCYPGHKWIPRFD